MNNVQVANGRKFSNDNCNYHHYHNDADDDDDDNYFDWNFAYL